MSESIRSQSASSEDDDMMDDAVGNHWSDENENEDEDQASPEDSSSSTAGEAHAHTVQGRYTEVIIRATS